MSHTEASLKVAAALYVKGDRLDPAAVTAAIGVTPTFARLRGERFANGKGVAKTGVWAIEVTLDGSAEQALRLLLSRLPTVPLSQQPAADDIYIDLFAVSSTDRARSEFKLDLDAKTLQHLAVLDIPFQFEWSVVPEHSERVEDAPPQHE